MGAMTAGLDPGSKAFRPALMLVDLQKGHLDSFTYEHGTVVSGLRRIEDLARACRSSGIPIILVNGFLYKEPMDEMVMAAGPDSRRIIKPGLSAFTNPKTDLLLSSMGTTSLILAGWVRHLCVKATASDALKMGYGLLLSDEGLFGISGVWDRRSPDAMRWIISMRTPSCTARWMD